MGETTESHTLLQSRKPARRSTPARSLYEDFGGCSETPQQHMPAKSQFRDTHLTNGHRRLPVDERLDAREGSPMHGKVQAAVASAWKSVCVVPELLDRIAVDPGVCFGRPTIRGHRVWASMILGYLAAGWTVEAVLVEYPALEADDVRACLGFAAQLASVRFADLDTAG